MPNVPPKGAWGRPDIGLGAATELVDSVATIIGETTPRNVLEIWVGDDTGVPVLVWVRVPDGPASATVGYVAGTPAALGKAAVSWVPLSPLRSDSYRVDRPDGSVVGTAAQGAVGLDDTAPRPLNGTYKVYSLLAGLVDATPAVTSAINLTQNPASFTAALVDNRPSGGAIYNHLVWTAPGYGKPHQYQIWRNGVFYVTVSGDTTSYDDTGMIMGSTMSYTVYPVLSGIKNATGLTAAVAVPTDPPTSVVLSNPAADTLRLSWVPPGQYSYFEIQKYDNTVGVWQAYNTTTGTSIDWTTPNPGYMRVRTVSANGVASGWVQAGPVTPKPPAPGILACRPITGNAFGVEIVPDAYPYAPNTYFCSEVYTATYPSWSTINATTYPCGYSSAFSDPPSVFQFGRGTDWAYLRVRAQRNGVWSDWTQCGPIYYPA